MVRQANATITRLRAANFRSIESIDLDLSNLTVFVGQNGAGKSNIIDILRFVRDSLTRSLDQALLDRGGLGAVRRFSAGSRGSDILVEVTCAVASHVVEYGFILRKDPKTEFKVRSEYITLREYRSREIRFSLRMDRGRMVKTPHMRANYGELFYPESELWLTKQWVLFLDPLSKEEALAMFTATRLLEDMSFYNISPETLRPPQQVVAESPLDEKGRNLAAVLRAVRKESGPESNDIQGALNRIVDGLQDYEIHNVGSYLVTKLVYVFTPTAETKQRQKISRVISDLAQESDGTLRVLSILAALYQQPSRPLVVIEEPEINIHPGALGVIADLLQEASLRSQILVTTHNPDLIEHFKPDVLRVVEKSDGVTHAGPVAHDQQEAIRKMLFSTAEIMKMEGLRRESAGV